jgi:chemotaxis signal transduction protein
VALAVDAVVGVRSIPPHALHELSPLFRDTSTDAITALGTLDNQLLIVLAGTRLVPDHVWNALEHIGAPR